MKEIRSCLITPRSRRASFHQKEARWRVLKAEETNTIVNDIVHDELTDEELSYYVSGCYTRGMTMQEAIDLTRATVDTGDRIRPKDGQVFWISTASAAFKQ